MSSRTITDIILGGAQTVEDVGEGCGAGTVCGKCVETIELLLNEHGY